MFRFQSLVLESGCGCIAVTSHPPTCPGEYQLSPQYKVHAPDPSFPPFWMMPLLTSFCGAGVLQTKVSVEVEYRRSLPCSWTCCSQDSLGRTVFMSEVARRIKVQASITWSSSECQHPWSTRLMFVIVMFFRRLERAAKCANGLNITMDPIVWSISLWCATNTFIFSYWPTMQVLS